MEHFPWARHGRLVIHLGVRMSKELMSANYRDTYMDHFSPLKFKVVTPLTVITQQCWGKAVPKTGPCLPNTPNLKESSDLLSCKK